MQKNMGKSAQNSNGGNRRSQRKLRRRQTHEDIAIEIGQRLGLTVAARRACGAWHIGAIDETTESLAEAERYRAINLFMIENGMVELLPVD